MLKVNPFEFGLKEVFEDPLVIKVFHDFCEDAASLVKNYSVWTKSVFDTQIAHWILKEFEEHENYEKNSASLNELLKIYLKV